MPVALIEQPWNAALPEVTVSAVPLVQESAPGPR